MAAPPQAQQPPAFAGESECWACGATVRVPCAASGSGAPAPAFFCGWCRAVNGTIPRARGGGPSLGRLIHTALRSAGRAFPLLSLTVIAAAVIAGVGWVLPALFEGGGGGSRGLALSTAAAGLASFHIFLHFAASAACRPSGTAGTVKLYPRGSVPQGAYEGHMQCWPCGGSHKPPGAHHCAACGVCVPDHDHHCFFTGGCVSGAPGGNARHFLLMLAWILVGTGYGLAASAALALRRRREVGRLLRSALATAAGADAASLLPPAAAPARLAGRVGALLRARGGWAAPAPPPPALPAPVSLALTPTLTVARGLLRLCAAATRVAGRTGGLPHRVAAQVARTAAAAAGAAALPAAALTGPPWFLALVTLAGICGAAFAGVAALAVQVLRRLADGASAADAVRPRLVLVGRDGAARDATPAPPAGVRAALGRIFGPGPAWRWVLPPYGGGVAGGGKAD